MSKDASATLIVRKLDRDLVDRLKRRAAEHGRSAEAEHRAILEEALHAPMSKDDFMRLLRGPKLSDQEFAEFEANLNDLDQPFEPPVFEDP